MQQQNIIITESPRSGTTLVCYLLNKLDNVVALNEPFYLDDFLALKSKTEMIRTIESLYGDNRKNLLQLRTAYSKHYRGKIPDNPAEDVSQFI